MGRDSPTRLSMLALRASNRRPPRHRPPLGRLGPVHPGAKSGPPVWNYARAVLRWTAAGCPLRPPEEQERIFAICQACPHYNAERVACSVCGCFLRRGSILFSKIAWQTEHCPLEKW